MNKIKKWSASFSIGFLSAMEHRFDFFIGLLNAVFPICIQIFLWIAVYGDSGQKTVVYGYTFLQMILYIIIAALVNKTVNTGVEYAINEDIHTGGIAKYLIKPVNYIMFRFMQTLGQQIISTVFSLLLSASCIIVFQAAFGFYLPPPQILLFFLGLFLGVILNFFIFFLISISSFWLTEAGSFFMTIQVIITVASGGVFPIAVLGKSFVLIMQYLPFIYTTYFPIQIITGNFSFSEICTGFAIQLFWIFTLSLFSSFLWKKGIRHYVAVGG